MFEAFQFGDFRWLWIGAFGSFMGMNMQMLTRGWLVLRLTDDSPLAVGLVMMSFAVPLMFVSPIAGVLADRISRKRLVIVSQLGNAVMTALLATLDLTGSVVFWHVFVLGMVNGAMMAASWPSRQAMISDIVPEGKLLNAIALANSSMNLTRVVGPAMAGVLIVVIDTAGVFYLVSGIYLLSALSMGMVRSGTTPASRSHKGMTSDFREGLAYVFRSPVLLGLMIMSFVPTLFGFSFYGLMQPWAREALDVQADGMGFLMMVMGIGALAGSLLLASMSGMVKGRGVFLLATCVAWGVALALFSQSTSYAAAVPLLLFVGLASAMFISLEMTIMQIHASNEMRGRVMSINMMTFGIMPLSALPFGALAERIGTPDALLLSGVLLVVFTLVFAVAYPSFRKIA